MFIKMDYVQFTEAYKKLVNKNKDSFPVAEDSLTWSAWYRLSTEKDKYDGKKWSIQKLVGWILERKYRARDDKSLTRSKWFDCCVKEYPGGASFYLLEQIMKQSPGVDAIFFCNDDLAQGALLAAMRLNISVPRQVAIAGFNDLTGSDQMWPPLTTVRTPRAQVGEAAAQMLLQLIQGESPAQAQVDLGFEIIERQTT